jgi:hypothetical protein
VDAELKNVSELYVGWNRAFVSEVWCVMVH